MLAQYRNPERPSETWAGRGKKPRWLAAHLKSGKRSTTFESATQRAGRSAGSTGFGFLNQLTQCLHLGQPSGEACGRFTGWLP
jgi:hypothetical protein